MTRKIGDRVVCVSSAEDNTVYIFGRGIYVGDEVPPKPMGLVAAVCGNAQSWEEVDEYYRKLNIPTGVGLRLPNPKIILDDEKIVWGCECWWGDEEAYKKRCLGNRKEVLIDINKVRTLAVKEK